MTLFLIAIYYLISRQRPIYDRLDLNTSFILGVGEPIRMVEHDILIAHHVVPLADVEAS